MGAGSGLGRQTKSRWVDVCPVTAGKFSCGELISATADGYADGRWSDPVSAETTQRAPSRHSDGGLEQPSKLGKPAAVPKPTAAQNSIESKAQVSIDHLRPKRTLPATRTQPKHVASGVMAAPTKAARSLVHGAEVEPGSETIDRGALQLTITQGNGEKVWIYTCSFEGVEWEGAVTAMVFSEDPTVPGPFSFVGHPILFCVYHISINPCHTTSASIHAIPH